MLSFTRAEAAGEVRYSSARGHTGAGGESEAACSRLEGRKKCDVSC